MKVGLRGYKDERWLQCIKYISQTHRKRNRKV